MLDWWWAYLALGAYAGFFSGLLGIGGGSAVVPVLAFVFAAKGFRADHAVHLALGTAIATMLFTSVATVKSHHARGAVTWAVLRAMAPGVLLGTFAGALLAGGLDVRLLSITFSVLMFYFAAQMMRTQRAQPSNAATRKSVLASFGAFVGFISSLSATGGASLVVPFLLKRNIRIHQAIGTAGAVGWPIAAGGTAGYVIAGWGVADLPPWSVGYVYLPALAGVAIASVVAAPLGAAVAHRTPGATLRKIFALLLFVLAITLLVKFV